MNNILKKYYKRVVLEGLIKSIILSLSVSLFVSALLLFIFWALSLYKYTVVILASSILFILIVPFLYFFIFHPTTETIAKKLDELGLEERIITMNELKNGKTYIAMKQREDAINSLEKINPKDIKIIISKSLLILLLISFLCVSSMTTVSALTKTGVLPEPGKIIIDIFDDEVYYTVKFVALDINNQDLTIDETPSNVGGMFEGLEEQLVAVGENSEPVLAVADPDWVFICWGDGSEDPYHIEESLVIDEDSFSELEKLPTDSNIEIRVFDSDRGLVISKDTDGNITITVFALFSELTDGKEGEDGDGLSEDEADAPQDGSPSDSDSDNDSQDKDQDSDDDQGDSDSTSKPGYKDNNNIVDGKTDYKTRLEEYIAKAEEYQKNGEEIPDYLLELIENYYELLS